MDTFSKFFFETLQTTYQLADILFEPRHVQPSLSRAEVSAQDQIIQCHMVQFRQLHQQINGAALLSSFNAAIKTSVDVERFCNFFLCEAVLDTELPDAAPQSQILGGVLG